MIRIKSCPRCHGDIRLDRDHYGWFEECLQCGYTRDLRSVSEFKQGTPEKRKVRQRVLVRRAS